jgi:outer membrane protein TolC
MGQTSKPFLTLLATCALVSTARAEAPPPARDAAAQEPQGSDAIPEGPEVKDPMLEPLPAAPNTLASWRDALRLVRTRSTALRTAVARVDQSAGATEQARALALPRLTSTGTLSHHLLYGTVNAGGQTIGPSGTPVTVPATVTIPNPGTLFNASLDLRQPVLNLGAWYGVGTARERERGAALSSQDTERVLLGTVAQAAVGTITATRVAESSRVSLASALSTSHLTKRRAELGAASAVDVLRAEQEVVLSRGQVVAADEQLLQAREALGAALGDTAGWSVAPDIKLDDLERTAGQICRPVESLDARADILAATKAVTAAERDRKSIDYTYVPTVDAASSLGYVSSNTRSLNGEHVTWTVGAIASWTIYDGGDRYGRARVNEAAATTARATLTETKRNATIQVTQADRAITVAGAKLAVSTSSRDLARETARLSRLAFISGKGTSFDLVDSARRLREAEIDLLIKDFGVFQARLTAFLARANCSI